MWRTDSAIPTIPRLTPSRRIFPTRRRHCKNLPSNTVSKAGGVSARATATSRKQRAWICRSCARSTGNATPRSTSAEATTSTTTFFPSGGSSTWRAIREWSRSKSISETRPHATTSRATPSFSPSGNWSERRIFPFLCTDWRGNPRGSLWSPISGTQGRRPRTVPFTLRSAIGRPAARRTSSGGGAITFGANRSSF